MLLQLIFRCFPLIFLWITISNALGQCPDDSFASEDFNGCVYLSGDTRNNWNDSKGKCEKKDGRLISVHNAFENAVLISLIYNANQQDRDHWIGLYGGNGWNEDYWVDGTSVDYEKWASNEPSQDAAMISPQHGGRWTTESDGYFTSHPFICLLPFLSPPEWSNCPPQWTHLAETSSCYLVGVEPKKYYDAERACEVMEATLASVHSDGENNILASLQSDTVGRRWLGGRFDNGRYTWEDGTGFNYQKPLHHFTDTIARSIAINIGNNGNATAGSWVLVNREEELASFICIHRLY